MIVVTVYTFGPGCMACQQTKRHLTKRGIKFTEQPIGDDSQLYAAFDELGFTTAPVVCASVDGDERYWDGYRPDRIDQLANGVTA